MCRSNARVPKGRKDFPGDNDVINESIVNIHKSIKFRKTADALIMSVLVLMRMKYLHIFVDRAKFYFEMFYLLYRSFSCCHYMLYRLYIFVICMNTKRVFFCLFSGTFPQYAPSSPPPYQFHGCNYDLLSFFLSFACAAFKVSTLKVFYAWHHPLIKFKTDACPGTRSRDIALTPGCTDFTSRHTAETDSGNEI